ncbi:MAG: biotin/lipoyl-containing protein [Bacteroidales bacterium]
MKHYKFVINGNQYEVEIKDYSNDVAELEVNGTPFRVEVEHKMTLTKTPKISRPVTRTPVAAAPVSVSGGVTPVISPLPGTIMQVIVKPGDKVQKGDKLLIMEAMKMENNIQADRDGTVSSVKVAAGDNVLQGAVLLELE